MRPAIGSAPVLNRVPATWFFLASAIFHYLGPSLAVLLFADVSVLGVAWLRIASAAAIFLAWRPRALRLFAREDARKNVFALGITLAAMNAVFYLAVARLPLSTVGSIEFLGTVVLAAWGLRTRRNFIALGITVAGVAALTEARLAGQPLGFAFAFVNCAFFMSYVVFGHRIANDGGDSLDALAASMLVAAVVITPVGLSGALPAMVKPMLLLAGIGVGVCSSVIPYITDQLAMARLPQATFALMLSLLPVFATLMGAAVLRQIPTWRDLAGIALVVLGVAIHRQETT